MGLLDRTKVVLRHLPPTISQENLVEHIDSRFSGRYHWLLFRPGKSSQKRLKHSRAYIDFNKPDDVIEFAAFFNGHAFVNEKGAQFKAIVEYAPSQRVPKEWSKKDGREATIDKDPEYLEFLESISKPVENLPSAEIQLERKEAERAVGKKDVPIVTPLMEYIRQKRAAKRSTMNGKPGKRVSGPPKTVASGSMKKGSGSKHSGSMYVSRESSKNVSRKLLPKEDRSRVEKSNRLAVSENTTLKGESGESPAVGEKKVLLLKGKETEMLQTTETPSKVSRDFVPSKQNQRHEAGGKITRNIILKREANQDQPALGSQSELNFQPYIHNTDQKTSQLPVQPLHNSSEGVPTEKVFSNDLTALPEKHERRARNKDRPDRVVWTPLRSSDGSHASHESLPSSSTKSQVMDTEEVEAKHEVLVARSAEYRPNRSRRGGHYSADNGSYRPGGRRSPAYSVKDADNSLVGEGKPSKRGLSGYGSQEKQVWIQKSGSST